MARRAWEPTRQRLANLRSDHAAVVRVHARHAGIEIGTPGAVPDGLDVPAHDRLVEEIRAVQPWFPPPEACVRGATPADDRDVVRVLVALERGHSLRMACNLAVEGPPRRAKPGAGESDELERLSERLRKGAETVAAYKRWLEAIRLARLHALSFAGETRDEYTRRALWLRQLVDRHGGAAAYERWREAHISGLRR